MKKKSGKTVKELKAKAPLTDFYELTPNARYLILYKKPRIITLNENDIKRQVDSITNALTALKIIACGVILDIDENLIIIEIQ